MLLALLLACSGSPSTDEYRPPPSYAGTQDDDGGSSDGGGSDGDSGQPTEEVEPYAGPDFQACVSDAQCEAGSWCTEVPGHAHRYCAPACDPTGDGSECQIDGVDFEALCLDNGRCARACEDTEVATEDAESGELIQSPDDTCPAGLECMVVDDEHHGETQVCAGSLAGGAGYYGVCTHPNVDGPDCPEESSCYGGSYLGLEDKGICLPWCDDNSCPSAPEGVTALPLCYDVGLDHPVCPLLCNPDDSVCPEEQECWSFGSFGLCVPEGADIGEIPI